ncbi:hypothetical protein CsSME_00040154 [Camellia sinensis var. sinensis]
MLLFLLLPYLADWHCPSLSATAVSLAVAAVRLPTLLSARRRCSLLSIAALCSPSFLIKKVCAKFRKKTLEHRELMETVFMGASVTGKHHWIPGEKLLEAANDSSNSVHSLGAQPFADPIPTGVQDVDSDSSLEHVSIEKGKRRKMPLTSVSKLKKATSGASVIAESMSNLTDVVRTKN